MGDNIFLGDRDGVRTPMQWSPDRNGGFSRADPARLYLPPIMDPVYGYQAVNVEAQSRSPSSLLNWTKRLIAVRKARRAFGRGDLRFLYPVEPQGARLSARSQGDETILCVVNLSRAPQAVELDLSELQGPRAGRAAGPQRLPADRRAALSADPAGLRLLLVPARSSAEVDPGWRAPARRAGARHAGAARWLGGACSTGTTARSSRRDVLPAYLPKQRWFAGKGRSLASASRGGRRGAAGREQRLAAHRYVEAAFRDGERQRYFLPLAVRWEDDGERAAQCAAARHHRRGAPRPPEGAIYRCGRRAALRAGAGRGDARGGARSPAATARDCASARTAAFARVALPESPVVTPHRRRADRTARSLIEEYGVLKLYRRLVAGVHPEIEMARFLTEVAQFANTPPLLGDFALRSTATARTTALGVLFAFVRNQGDGWSAGAQLSDALSRRGAADGAARARGRPSRRRRALAHPLYLELAAATRPAHGARCIARSARTGRSMPAFAPEPITAEDLGAVARPRHRRRRATFDNLARRARRAAGLRRKRSPTALLPQRERCCERFDDACCRPRDRRGQDALSTAIFISARCWSVQNDFYIIDFEGEPLRPLAERRRRARRCAMSPACCAPSTMPAPRRCARWPRSSRRRLPVLQERAEEWRRQVTDAFLARYREAMGGCPLDAGRAWQADALLDFFTLEKALYEIDYELAQPPGLGRRSRSPACSRDQSKPERRRSWLDALSAARRAPSRRGAATAIPSPFSACTASAAISCVRVFLPGRAASRWSTRATGEVAGELPRIHEDGLFVGACRSQTRASAIGCAPRARRRRRVRRRLPLPAGARRARHPSAGRRHASRQLRRCSARIAREHDGVDGVAFAVWAPNARRVSVVGDFNDWDGRRHPMRLRHGGGVWEIFVPGLAPGHALQVRDPRRRRRAAAAQGRSLCRARRAAAGHRLASSRRRRATSGSDGSGWRRAARATTAHAPISIYEVHLGSWRREPERGQPLSDLSRAGRAAGALCRATWASPISS